VSEDEDFASDAAAYIKAIRELLKVPRHDDRGNQITSFLASEEAKILEAGYTFAYAPWGKYRAAVKLPREARKHVVVFLGLFSVIIQDAKKTGRKIIFLAPDNTAEAFARLEFVALKNPVVDRVEFGFATWDELDPSTPLASLWVIGDLDWSGKPLAGDQGKRAIAAVGRVLADGACRTILLHQEGKIPMIPFPSELSSVA
jgi:hypothetical protein